jgi:hypothetical protein
MTPPKWNDPNLKAGTMIRTALWLISEVGVGNSFTKEQHRGAFSGIAQADRRLRDLRDYGWVIHTSAEDATLRSDEQRLVAVGSAVWEVGARKTRPKDVPSAKVRREAFADSDYQCAACGIAAGESYPDVPNVVAVLAASRRTVKVSGGRLETMFVAECKRCRAGTPAKPVDIAELLKGIEKLDAADRSAFARWTERGRRAPLDRLWSEFRLLPAAARDEIRKRLKGT